MNMTVVLFSLLSIILKYDCLIKSDKQRDQFSSTLTIFPVAVMLDSCILIRPLGGYI